MAVISPYSDFTQDSMLGKDQRLVEEGGGRRGKCGGHISEKVGHSKHDTNTSKTSAICTLHIMYRMHLKKYILKLQIRDNCQTFFQQYIHCNSVITASNP